MIIIPLCTIPLGLSESGLNTSAKLKKHYPALAPSHPTNVFYKSKDDMRVRSYKKATYRNWAAKLIGHGPCENAVLVKPTCYGRPGGLVFSH